MYNPKIGDAVIVDYAVLKKRKIERFGTIINKAQRANGRGYDTIYFVRTGPHDVVQCRLGQFINASRRHHDHEYLQTR